MTSGTHDDCDYVWPYFYTLCVFFCGAFIEKMNGNWMASIKSETICNFFYFFYVFYAVIAVITVLGMIGILTMIPMSKGLKMVFGFQNLIVFGLAATAALFHYLVCQRALLGGQAAEAQKVRAAPGMNPDMMM